MAATVPITELQIAQAPQRTRIENPMNPSRVSGTYIPLG